MNDVIHMSKYHVCAWRVRKRFHNKKAFRTFILELVLSTTPAYASMARLLRDQRLIVLGMIRSGISHQQVAQHFNCHRNSIKGLSNVVNNKMKSEIEPDTGNSYEEFPLALKISISYSLISGTGGKQIK